MENIEGRTDIVKDPNTGAVISIDSEAHRAAVESAKARESAKDQLTTKVSGRISKNRLRNLSKQIMRRKANLK